MTDYLPEVQGLWPDYDRPTHYIRVRFAEVNGLMEPVWVEVRSVRDPDGERPGSLLRGSKWSLPDEPTPVTKELLRRLPLVSLIEDAKRSQGEVAKYLADTIPERRAELLAKEKQWRASAKPQRGGMPELSPGHYRKVAEVYVKAASSGAPTMAVAKHFSVSKGAAAKWVGRARQRGFLPPTRRGKVAI